MNIDDLKPVVQTPPKEFVYRTDAPPAITKPTPQLLPLYNEKNPMLAMVQPEFNVGDSPVNIIDFANAMLHTMNHYGGAGLAAPQCGFPYRLFVMVGGIVCINPVILESSKETVQTKEGCLSFPGLYLSVTRPETIHIKYLNEFGKPVEATWNGATAKIAQHELDHLNGIVYTKHVGNLTLQMAKKKRKKLFKKIQQIVEHKERQLKIEGKDKTYGRETPTSITHHFNSQAPSTAVHSNREN
jgi:peptide deformylase